MTTWRPLPTEKSFDIDEMIMRLYGKNRQLTIINRECMACDVGEIVQESFTDEQSFREYHIGGLCQSCQNKIFGGTEK